MISLNPSYTEEMKSTFVLDTTEKEVNKNMGLVLKVKDWDRVGANDTLGEAAVLPEVLLEATGKDIELKLLPPSEFKGQEAGFVTLRCRPASDEDRKPKKTLFGRLGLESGGKISMSRLLELHAIHNLR